jgi:hypothetical protein
MPAPANHYPFITAPNPNSFPVSGVPSHPFTASNDMALLSSLLATVPALEQRQQQQHQQHQQQRALEAMFPSGPIGMPSSLNNMTGALPNMSGQFFPSTGYGNAMPTMLGQTMPVSDQSSPLTTTMANSVSAEVSTPPANTDKVQELVKLLLQCKSILRNSTVIPSAPAPTPSFDVFNDQEAWAATMRLLTQ